jgi:hypothetical protein
MHFVKFRGVKTAFYAASFVGLIFSSFAVPAMAETSNGVQAPVGPPKIDPEVLKAMTANMPSYGGTFAPGVGASVDIVGAPVIDAASLAKAVEKRLQQAVIDAQKLLMDNAITKALGMSGENKVDAVNNGAGNMITRVNKALEDENNMDAIKNTMVSKDACRDIALSMSNKLGGGCDTINNLREMFLGRPSKGAGSTLMTIARGLNSSFGTAQTEDMLRVNRIAQKYTEDLKQAKPVGVYNPSRFSSEEVTTYDQDQLADLPDYIYAQIRPYVIPKDRKTSMEIDSVLGAADQTNAAGFKLTKELIGDVFADSFMDKVPGDTTISPYEAMREFAKGKNSPEYLESIATGQDLNSATLRREQAIILSFKIHQQVVAYQRSLKEEQIAAKSLDGMISQSFVSP